MKNKLTFLSAVLVLTHFSLMAQTPIPDAIVESDQVNAQLGQNVASAGDINGDGFDDVIVGAWNYDGDLTNEGAAFIYLGSASGLSTTPDAILEGNQSYAYFGRSVASAGDVNADGFDDVIVSAWYYDNGQTNEGVLFIYHGSADGITTSPAALLECNQSYAYFGCSVSSAGDINGDGFDDVIGGSQYYSNGQSSEGRMYVFLGSADGVITTPIATMESNQVGASLGFSCAGVGDVNGDGFDDLVAGANNYTNGEYHEGRVYIYHGNATGVSTTAALTIEGNQIGCFFGWSSAAAGDTNGDGYSDILIGAPSYDDGELDEGRAYVYLGSAGGIDATTAIIINGNQVSGSFAYAVSGAGDANNDGYDDIIVGGVTMYNDQVDEGILFVYGGSSTGIMTTPIKTMESDQDNAWLGYAVGGGGDVNGDGFDDLIGGALFYDNGQIDEGGAFVYYGSKLCEVPTISISAGGATTFCQGGSVVLTASHTGTSLQWKKNGVNIAGATGLTYTVFNIGEYTCETTNACGSEISNAIVVTVNKNPKAIIAADGPTTFCAGDDVTLTVTPVGGSTYQWYNGVSAIAGATTTSYVASTAGNYKCRVTKTATGCYKNSSVIAVAVTCREGEIITENTFQIYPNPADQTLTIETNLSTEKTIYITNTHGQLVQTIQSSENIIHIEIKDLARGMYYVKMEDGVYLTIQKFIKQ